MSGQENFTSDEDQQLASEEGHVDADRLVAGHQRQGHQRSASRIRALARESNSTSLSLLSSAASPEVANEVRSIFRGGQNRVRETQGNSTPVSRPLRRVGPLFTPPAEGTSRRRNRGSTFRRTVILLPYGRSEVIPRGAFRDRLVAENMEVEVEFTTSMTAEAIARRIVSSFQNSGYLQNLR